MAKAKPELKPIRCEIRRALFHWYYRELVGRVWQITATSKTIDQKGVNRNETKPVFVKRILDSLRARISQGDPGFTLRIYTADNGRFQTVELRPKKARPDDGFEPITEE